jgi:hypothetical protein
MADPLAWKSGFSSDPFADPLSELPIAVKAAKPDAGVFPGQTAVRSGLTTTSNGHSLGALDDTVGEDDGISPTEGSGRTAPAIGLMVSGATSEWVGLGEPSYGIARNGDLGTAQQEFPGQVVSLGKMERFLSSTEHPNDGGEDAPESALSVGQLEITSGRGDPGGNELSLLAANLTVTTLADEAFGGGSLEAETADGGGLSLREALGIANAQAGTDTIDFDAALTGGTLTLTGGDLTISSDLVIDGDINDDGASDITVSGNYASRVFNVTDGTSTISGLAIVNGDAGSGYGDYGGGILVGATADLTVSNSTLMNNSAFIGGGVTNYYGTVTLTNSSLSGNFAYYDGGGMINAGTATLTNVTLSDNYSGLDGGGLSNFGTATLTNTTFFGNYAWFSGGGLYNSGAGTLTLTNSTFSGNEADVSGGGLANYGTATVADSTFSGNTASYRGGGLYNSSYVYTGNLTLTNSIVLGNSATYFADEFYAGSTVTKTGGNIIGTNIYSGSTGIGNTSATAVFASVVNGAGVLADNGGEVQTIALKVGGDAQDAGDATLLPADAQDLDGDANTAEDLPLDSRGVLRVMGGELDLGAFELTAGSSGDDFNGDGTSDILWFNAVTGSVGQFEMNNGSPTWRSIGTSGANWEITGTGDFNGDGTDDILWFNRHRRHSVVQRCTRQRRPVRNEQRQPDMETHRLRRR